MCCKVLGITELQKPVGKWCPHCDIGKGCKIYESRPKNAEYSIVRGLKEYACHSNKRVPAWRGPRRSLHCKGDERTSRNRRQSRDERRMAETEMNGDEPKPALSHSVPLIDRVAVDPTIVASFATESDFTSLAVSLMVETASYCCVAAATLGQSQTWDRDRAAVGSNMVRQYKLLDSFLDRICKHRDESSMIMRADAPTAAAGSVADLQ
jgi:hypothetical protein